MLAHQVSNQYGPSETTGYSTEFIQKKSSRTKKMVPIGKPIANTRVYILDNHLNLTLLGAVGELHIAGVGLARGYLNQPELTASRFIPNPFASEEDKLKGYIQLYKTGDLVRWLPDGNLEYVGRNDFQVKIRGFRIELEEIEQRLLSYPGVKQATVVAKERNRNNKYLVAYYTAKSSISEFVLRSYIKKGLPEYMVPSCWMRLTKFPLTSNSKLDRRALPDPQFRSDEAHYVAPRTELEQTLSEVWQLVLGLKRVGIQDDFFRIGGDSILSLQVSYRASKVLNTPIEAVDIFRYKTIEQLSQHIKRGLTALKIPIATSDYRPLSFAQERLWFIEQYEQGTNAYHIPLVFELAEEMNIDGLIQALQAVIQRHTVLHTVFKYDESGIDQQVILKQPLVVHRDAFENKKTFYEQVKMQINQPFNLAEAHPLRAAIYTFDQVNYLLITIHHVSFDGWSTEILIRELCQYYNYIVHQQMLNLPELSIQYKDFAVWQRDYLQGKLLAKQMSYWKSKLQGMTPLIFPTDRPRPKKIDYQGKSVCFVLDECLSQELRLLAKQHSCTLYTVLLAGFTILLNIYTGQYDIVIGSPVANRSYSQLEHLIGFFVNSLVLRVRFSAEMSGKQLLKQVHQTVLEAQSYQDLPFDQLVKQLKLERDPSRHPIFQVMFNMQSFSGTKQSYFRKIYLEDSYEVSNFDFDLFIDNGQHLLKGHINYAVSLFNRSTMKKLAIHYQKLLEQLIHNPTCKLESYRS
ncbi:MAG: condensation domain-containing protein [Candidatus Aquirickettsiella sp.]